MSPAHSIVEVERLTPPANVLFPAKVCVVVETSPGLVASAVWRIRLDPEITAPFADFATESIVAIVRLPPPDTSVPHAHAVPLYLNISPVIHPLAAKSAKRSVPSRILPDVTALAPIVKSPADERVASPERV